MKINRLKNVLCLQFEEICKVSKYLLVWDTLIGNSMDIFLSDYWSNKKIELSRSILPSFHVQIEIAVKNRRWNLFFIDRRLIRDLCHQK